MTKKLPALTVQTKYFFQESFDMLVQNTVLKNMAHRTLMRKIKQFKLALLWIKAPKNSRFSNLCITWGGIRIQIQIRVRIRIDIKMKWSDPDSDRHQYDADPQQCPQHILTINNDSKKEEPYNYLSKEQIFRNELVWLRRYLRIHFDNTRYSA